MRGTNTPYLVHLMMLVSLLGCGARDLDSAHALSDRAEEASHGSAARVADASGGDPVVDAGARMRGTIDGGADGASIGKSTRTPQANLDAGAGPLDASGNADSDDDAARPKTTSDVSGGADASLVDGATGVVSMDAATEAGARDPNRPQPGAIDDSLHGTAGAESGGSAVAAGGASERATPANSAASGVGGEPAPAASSGASGMDGEPAAAPMGGASGMGESASAANSGASGSGGDPAAAPVGDTGGMPAAAPMAGTGGEPVAAPVSGMGGMPAAAPMGGMGGMAHGGAGDSAAAGDAAERGGADSAEPTEMPQGPWTDAWSRTPLSAAQHATAVQPSQFVDQTLRVIVWPTTSGTQARVKLTNAYSTAPLAIGAVHLATRSAGGSIVPDSDRILNFQSLTTATIAAGAELWSDPVAVTVTAHADLAISIYVPSTFTPASYHATGLKTSYLSSTGNYAATETMPASGSDATTTMVFFAAEVQVRSDAAPAQIVALGDSITDGYCSDVDTNGDWPDLLSTRITSLPNRTPVSVINAGISSNRFTSSDAAGLRGLSRLPELLGRPGVRWVILFEGVNDISYEHITPDDLIEAYEKAIALAHAARVKIFGVPLLPIAHSQKDTPDNQATRAAVNAWIRNSGAYDGVIDFEPVIADPKDPTSMRAELTCDHVHPNQAGYRALADSIDLSLFR